MLSIQSSLFLLQPNHYYERICLHSPVPSSLATLWSRPLGIWPQTLPHPPPFPIKKKKNILPLPPNAVFDLSVHSAPNPSPLCTVDKQSVPFSPRNKYLFLDGVPHFGLVPSRWSVLSLSLCHHLFHLCLNLKQIIFQYDKL